MKLLQILLSFSLCISSLSRAESIAPELPFPSPSGLYPVSLHFDQVNLPNLKVPLAIFYPSKVKPTHRISMSSLYPVTRKIWHEMIQTSSFDDGITEMLKTNQQSLEISLDAKGLNQPFPVLVFFNGSGGSKEGYYGFLSELSSQGLIIIDVDTAMVSPVYLNLESKFYRISRESKSETFLFSAAEQAIQKVSQWSSSVGLQFKLDEVFISGHSQGGRDAKAAKASSQFAYRGAIDFDSGPNCDPSLHTLLILSENGDRSWRDDLIDQEHDPHAPDWFSKKYPFCEISAIAGTTHHSFTDLVYLIEALPGLAQLDRESCLSSYRANRPYVKYPNDEVACRQTRSAKEILKDVSGKTIRWINRILSLPRN
jgi:predicted esterase